MTEYAWWAGREKDEQYEALVQWVAENGMESLRKVDPVTWDALHDDSRFLMDVDFA